MLRTFLFLGSDVINISEYLYHLPLACVESIFEDCSRKENLEQYGYLLPIIKEVLEKRKKDESEN